MLCPRERPGELARFYTVSEPRRHPRGHTVYKVTARIVSRRNPEDVQEKKHLIVVWKRYSDFKKLHKDLWQIHKNLYRHTELFPPFAKAIVFGRFDETVIEERRQCAEDLLQFSANIPALYNSKQFEDFFKGGEVHDGSELIGPVEPLSDSLIDSLSDCSSEVRKDLSGLDDVTLTSQSECGGFSSDSDLISLTVDVDSLPELDDGMASDQNSPSRAFGLGFPSEALAQSSVASEHEWSKPEGERENRSLFTGSVKPKAGKQDYLEKAGELIKLALKKEEEEDYEAAFGFYRKGVDLLLEGVQGESSPTRREAVKRKTAEYLMRAEKISTLYQKSSTEDGSLSVPLGSLSSRPSWNLRSPAEELKAFRVLGVIDKVLLVMDTRTQETLILKGLRKSSEYSRNRKTIIPRCVPNMVCLHKYIISEESVFLVLQHAEGGKLWSYISAKEHSIDGDAVEGEAVLLFSDQTEDFGNEDANPVLLPKVESEETASKDKSERATEGEMEIHQIFQDLDNRLALTSRFHIPEDCIQRWAAEMVVALDALHRQGIVCRDLNPNNILLNDRGHIQLTYFSRWSEVEDSCDNDAIERMYCAPEVGAILEETEACDWWSLGAILFELLTGKTLVECHPAGINTHTSLNVPDHISEEARSLIQQLLQFNPVERLGAGAAGAEDIKSHPFFAPVNWADLVG
ncbi:ribosomal protein S6 kinase delta-1 isoform D [Alligator mississippiensis]|uniref:Ribosomal protein S6 kinase delta-1 n=1 Tax=Alligator mississippiensis TaxID=8496 RepID=A0A151P3W6_ALLMI|nr:ribosomal protein S6 kinase delta-1 isoform D [Alligator mississippiensis]